MKKLSIFISKLVLSAFSILLLNQNLNAAGDGNNKVLIIGIDGLIYSVIDYASTPSIDELIGNATYNMNGYGGSPSFSSTGWATLMTGVSAAKHGVTLNNTFEGNNFATYPSIISRIKAQSANTKIASIVRDSYINDVLNTEADIKFSYNSDEEVLQKSIETIKNEAIEVEYVQFSSPKEAGEQVGFLLRDAQYVLAAQNVDNYVGQLYEAIKTRPNFKTENWSVYLVSTHGGSPTGEYTGTTIEELNVPIILSGNSLDNKFYDPNELDPLNGADNILGVQRTNVERNYVRIPIAGTALQGMDKFTIEMWIKAHDNNSSDPSIIGDKDWDSGGNPGFTICRSGSSWKINIANQTGQRYDIGNSEYTIENGSWHHLAVSFDKTKECIIYQDGEMIGSSILAYTDADNIASPYDYLCLAQEGTETYGGGYQWSGAYNEVRIWTDVLPQETIAHYMNLRNIETSNHPYLSSLNLYFKFDETRGTVITDYSGKGNNGELMGSSYYRNPYYSLKLTDISINVINHLRLNVDNNWKLEGNGLKVGVPYRLFKVN